MLFWNPASRTKLNTMPWRLSAWSCRSLEARRETACVRDWPVVGQDACPLLALARMRAQELGDGEHVLAVRHRGQDLLAK